MPPVITALILDAVGDRRPAVVLALARDVHFIAAARAVLDLPQLARLRVQGRRLDVAVPEGPDLWTHALLADERVVLGNAAVRVDAHQFADQAVHRAAMASIVQCRRSSCATTL